MSFYEASVYVNITATHGHLKIQGSVSSVILEWDRTADDAAGESELEALIVMIPEFLEAVDRKAETGDVVNLGLSGASLMVLGRQDFDPETGA